jgi:lipopolysaccharide biosynthesis glycosyltransferase
MDKPMAQARRIIISGADSGYFELLKGCIRSIRDKPAGRDIALGVLDVGLGEAERRWLLGQDAVVVDPGWDIDFPERASAPRYRLAQYGRPFLPGYFPGYDLYMWLDADAWVQDWQAVELFFRGATGGSLAVVPELDRAYRNFFHAWEEFHAVIRRSYLEGFDVETADRLVRHPLLNSGAFALAADAPHWKAWESTLRAALQRSRNDLIEQAALNHVIYAQNQPAHFLPSWCNWICHHATPIRDTVGGPLVEPNLPHHRLGIVHLTMWMKSRRDLQYGPTDNSQPKTDAAAAPTYPCP